MRGTINQNNEQLQHELFGLIFDYKENVGLPCVTPTYLSTSTGQLTERGTLPMNFSKLSLLYKPLTLIAFLCFFIIQSSLALEQPFSYTKLDASGNDLPDSATTWSCVRDNLSGLIWEVKTPENMDKVYLWNEALTFVDSVNASGLCGFNDWRVPEITELQGLVTYQKLAVSPVSGEDALIDINSFPYTGGLYHGSGMTYWSKTPVVSSSNRAWTVSFSDGFTTYAADFTSTINPYLLRLVRGDIQKNRYNYTKMGSEGNLLPESFAEWQCVLDEDTGLVWQIKTFDLLNLYAPNSILNQQSFDLVEQYVDSINREGLCGFHDWYLPEIWELLTLVDYSRFGPASDTDYFVTGLESAGLQFWSATQYPIINPDPDPELGGLNWALLFQDGYTTPVFHSIPSVAGLVRSRQPIDFNVPDLTTEPSVTWSWSSQVTSPLYRYRLNNNDFSQGYTETSTTTFTPEIPLLDGQHTLYVQVQYPRALDGQKIWSVPTASTISVDTRPPVTNAVFNGSTKSNLLTFSFECEDNVSGCDQTFVNGELWEPGKTLEVTASDNFTFYSVDKAGHREEPQEEQGEKYIGQLTISGSVTHESEGLKGVTLNFIGSDNDTADTNADGYYSEAFSPGWSGTVIPSKQAYTFTPEEVEISNLAADQSFSFTATAVESEEQARVIIVAGGGDPDDPLWPATNATANFAYRSLLYKGISKENIRYFNAQTDQDVDGDGENNDILEAPGIASLQQSIETWAKESVSENIPVIVYLLDHGLPDTFFLTKRLDGEAVSIDSATLDGWLDNLQNATNTKLVVVYDACFSGSFMQGLKATGSQRRILLFSADDDELAYFGSAGGLSFSSFFWAHSLKGKSIRESFIDSRRDIRSATNNVQNAQMDDNGDGVWDSHSDGSLASLTYLGNPFVTAAALPQIISNSGDAVLTDAARHEISAKVDLLPEQLSRVWAVLVPPTSATGSVAITELPETVLTYDEAGKTWRGAVAGLDQSGVYLVVIYAQAKDESGFVSLPSTLKLAVSHSQASHARVLVDNSGLYIDLPNLTFMGQNLKARLQLLNDMLQFGLVNGSVGLADSAAVNAILSDTSLGLHIPALQYADTFFDVRLKFVPEKFAWELEAIQENQ